MNAEKKRILEESLLKILRNIKRGPDQSFMYETASQGIVVGKPMLMEVPKGLGNPFGPGLFIGGPEGKSYIAPEDRESFNDIIEKMLQEDIWKQTFSRKYIETKIKDLCSGLVNGHTPENINTAFSKLVKELDEFDETHVVYVPLEGLVIKMNSFALGNVVFVMMDEKNLGELQQGIESALLSGRDTEEKKQLFVEQLRPLIHQLGSRPWAKVPIKAEADKAKDLAEAEVRESLDLLKYAIPSLFNYEERVIIGLEGEVPRMRRITPILRSDSPGFSMTIEAIGNLRQFVIDDHMIEAFSQMRILDMASILVKPLEKRTEFEKSLLSAIHWFAESQNQFEMKHKFLSLIICLECILTPGKGAGIRRGIGQGAAMVLANDLAIRKKIVERISKYYEIRNDLAHGGNADLNSERLSELEIDCWHVIHILIGRRTEFETRKQLSEWIEEQLLR